MSGWLRVRLWLDRVIAAALLPLAAPVVGIFALLVRRDGGPGLIRVPRVGRGGTTFGMWKLRTMKVGDAGGLADGPQLTRRDDERVTRVGRHLRKARVDELPQLWNIFRGQMTLVGPRPEAPVYVDVAEPEWQLILRVPPGVAGLTQALAHRWEADQLTAGGEGAYRSTVLPVKRAIDEWYVRSACPSLDVWILRALVGTNRERARRRLLGIVSDAGVAGVGALGEQ